MAYGDTFIIRAYDFGQRVIMNSFVGYGALTLAIIWIAALISSIGNISTFGFWFTPLLLTIFVLVLGVVYLRVNK